jgi:hypothetical protein
MIIFLLLQTKMENETVFIKTEEEEESDGVVSSSVAETEHIKTER